MFCPPQAQAQPAEKEIMILSSWFMKFMDWYRRFMYGRYGADKLTAAILIVYFIFYLSAQIARSYVLLAISLVIFVWCWYRVFSRNVEKRRNENEICLKGWNKVKTWAQTMKGRIRDRKTHRYFRCPTAPAHCASQRGKGKSASRAPCAERNLSRKRKNGSEILKKGFGNNFQGLFVFQNFGKRSDWY